ncbi:MAG: hypothetical protein ACJZ85_04495 [Pontiellaceae bacterium]
MTFLSPVVGVLFSIVGQPLPELSPPRVDYCQAMQQEIQGKKHGFLAGNKTYYIGGFHPVWNNAEDETIGFTHPFFNDLRCRGRAMVSHPETGYGHDLSGWEFYKFTKVAYGSVIVDGIRYENPIPVSMIWRPDRMICIYEVAGISIQEEKFITTNDVACTIISSDQPISLEFEGQSFADNKTTYTNATCQLDMANNSIHIIEGGEGEAIPIRTNGVDVILTGPLMYDDLNTVISASEPIQNFTSTDNNGQQLYSFTLPCDSNGLSLVWTMDDSYSSAISNISTVLDDPETAKNSKTEYMNDILNNEIPYFRCSDQDIVDVYYYLWALQMMYMIDLDEGFEQYPHTQTAVHNFLGLHRFDANFQIQVGSWAADKHNYANGNVLVWKSLLPYADLSTGRIPADNMGKGWYSGLPGSLAGHVVGAWKIYEHSGDEVFLQEAYSFYRELMWDSIPGIWGYQYAAADRLSRMATILGYPQEEAEHWSEVVNASNMGNWLDSMWQKNGVTNYFGAGEQNNSDKPEWRRKGWNSFAYLAMDEFPHDWAFQMTEYWAMNAEYGFNLNGHFTTTAQVDWDLVENKNFMVTPDAHWFAICGMYKQHVDHYANTLTLHHLKNYNMKWGIPIAPEAMKETLELHGDQYSNFNAGKILLILEGIFGLSYSVVDDVFTVGEHMPDEWDYMETYVPIMEDGRKYWTHVKVERDEIDGLETRTVKVNGNRLSNLKIEPWLNNKGISSASSGYSTNQILDNIYYDFKKKSSASIEVKLTNVTASVTNEVDSLGNYFFEETFAQVNLSPDWQQNGLNHLGIDNGFYRFSDIADNSSTQIWRPTSPMQSESFSTSINCKLGPFRTPNTKTDFSWSISGIDGSISLNLNSYGRLQLRHNAYGEGVFVLNEEIGIEYDDYQDLGMEIVYNGETEVLSVSYSVDGETIIPFYEGDATSINGFQDIISVQTAASLYKFNNNPSDPPVISIDSWDLMVIE